MTAIHSKRFYKSIFILFFASILCVPLVLKAQTDTQNIKNIIIGYNEGIIKASKTDKTDHMKAFAKKDIIKKFHLWIKSWHDNNLFMDAKIIDMVFKKIEIKDNIAVVITDEKWVYKYINIKTKKQTCSDTEINYVITYTLLKQNNKWIIQKIDVTSEKK